MRNPFRTTPDVEPVAAPTGDDASTLSQIRRLTADDEQPTREDRRYGETIFTRPPFRCRASSPGSAARRGAEPLRSLNQP